MASNYHSCHSNCACKDIKTETWGEIPKVDSLFNEIDSKDKAIQELHEKCARYADQSAYLQGRLERLQKVKDNLCKSISEWHRDYDSLKEENEHLKKVIRQAMRFLLDNTGSTNEPRTLTMEELNKLFTMLDVGVNDFPKT